MGSWVQGGTTRLVCSVSYLQSCSSLATIPCMDAHMMELAYTPVPKGGEQHPRQPKPSLPVEHSSVQACHPDSHLHSTRGSGASLGRCSDTGDP